MFLLIFVSIAFGQEYPEKKVHNLLKSGINDIIDQDYSSAEKVFRILKSDHSDIPLGDIYLSALHITKSLDYGESFNEKYISEHLDKAELMSKVLLEKEEDNVWNNYFMALCKGYSAYYKALQKNYISAFSDGITSKQYFEKCLKLDTTFYEAYMAVGTYQYWKSEKTEFLQWLPFISDERVEGIRNLEIAIKHPSYNHSLAVHSLIWIYINKKEYDKAIHLVEKILTKHPDSRFFKETLADIYSKIDVKKAIQIYKEVLNSYLRLPHSNHVNEIVIKHKIAQLYHLEGENERALKLCNEVLEISLPDSTKEKLDERLDRIKILKKELSGS